MRRQTVPGGRGRILLGSILLLLLPRSRWRNRPLLSRACSWRRRRTQSGGSRRTKAPWIKKRRWGFEIATKKLIFFRSRLSHQQRSRRLRHHLQASSAQFTSLFSWCTRDIFHPPIFFAQYLGTATAVAATGSGKGGSFAPWLLFSCCCCHCPSSFAVGVALVLGPGDLALGREKAKVFQGPLEGRGRVAKGKRGAR